MMDYVSMHAIHLFSWEIIYWLSRYMCSPSRLKSGTPISTLSASVNYGFTDAP